MMWILAAAVVGFASPGGVEWVSHRGESADAPENTMAAFRLAWERKVPAIELDVHLAKDGNLVVIHDADTKRTTGVARAVKSSTYEELASLDAGRWKDARWAGEKLPLLGEALATIPEGARCFIEVKVGPEAVPALVEAVRASGKQPEQLVVIAFNPDTLAEAKRKLPELKMYFLSSPRKDEQTGRMKPSLEELIAKAREINADGLDLGHAAVDAEWVKAIRAAGLGIYVWTVDDPAEARRLIDAGVDGITTNRAAFLRDAVSGR